MKRAKLFFDLDGTLIDSMPRLYHLFRELVPDSVLNYNEYRELKRSGQSHFHILTGQFGYTEEQTVAFEERWMPAIEEERFLQYDQPFPGITEYLISLEPDHELYVITARQSAGAAQKQIASFGWNFFKETLVTKEPQEKAALISGSGTLSNADWIIGDTEREIRIGKQLGIRTAAVLSGFRNRELLEQYHPDLLADMVTDLKL